MALKALHPILYRSKQYNIGDALPMDDGDMVDAWLDAGTAALVDEGDASEETAAKAFPVTAEAGLPGVSDGGESEAPLVGKISKTPMRSKK